MDFTIVTPSFRNSSWLKLCIPSVADQSGVSAEHIVQDACSDDGTRDWLPKDPRVKAFIEKDGGMYDAVNRGFDRSNGDLLAYLNCDEQYLPGALLAVKNHFAARPAVDAVIADTVVVNPRGDYLCHRYAYRPLPGHIFLRFTVLTSSLFIRRRVFFEKGVRLDTRWRDLGDLFWINDMLKQQVRFSVLRQITSVFTETGDNMNLKPNAIRESALKDQSAPIWVKRLRWLLIGYHRWRMLSAGTFWKRPFDFSLYTADSPSCRETKRAIRPTALWTRPAPATPAAG